MRTYPSIEAFAQAQGDVFGPGEWFEVEQAAVDQFAEATGDRQWIHGDPERAKDGPFGGTIAHGYFTLSLLPALLGRLYRVDGVGMAINYGLNRVRFPTPVPVGARVRLSAVLTEVRLGAGFVECVVTATIEIEGSAKPGCVAQTVSRLYR
jgi:acyl dehydratase